MLCSVCREGLEGIWDPAKTKRIGLIRDFTDVLHLLHPYVENDDEFEGVLNEYELLEPEHYVFGHHVDYDSVLRSKEQGCVACTQFDNIEPDDQNELFGALGFFSAFTINISRRDMARPSMTVFWGEMLEQFFNDMVVHDENDTANSAITPSTSDPPTWVMIETWLDECLRSHNHCAAQPLSGFVPTRLLELCFSDGQLVFRLVPGSKLEPGERYATLSHCWGTGPAEEKLRLLEKTERMLKDGMPVGILPKLFRQAFEIIAKLEIRYLWIDRLCIIQDSDQDWRTEAATMQTVYRNGFLNIAALGAKDDQDGCFFDRDPMLVAPTVLSLSSDNRGPTQLYRLEAEDDSWHSTFEGEPLLSRAWVLQERVLAARNLYFGRKQVFWECCESNHCETFPKTTLVKSPASSKRASLIPNTASLPHGWKPLIHAQDKDSHGRNLLGQWNSAVQKYCECSLTFPNDKLVALSGLAKHMGDKLSERVEQDEYLAGLWRTSMPGSLLWKVKGFGRRPPLYRAPSWTWASLDGDIMLESGAGAPPWYVDVVGAHVLPHGEDATGELVGGHLHLSGPLCIATGLQKSKMAGDHRAIIKSFRRPDTMALMDLPFDNASVQFDTDDQYDDVAVLIFRADSLSYLPLIDCRGLAVVPIRSPKLMYRRVGYATIMVRADEEGLSEPSEVLDKCLFTTIEMI